MSIALFCFLLFFLYGICIGSFLNVVIYRLPLKLPIAHGARSMCPKCRHTLHAADLVPVFSYLFLRGKCRYCGEPISLRYPLVELLTGCLFGLAAAVYDITPYAVLLCLFFSALIIAWFTDLDHTWIPDCVHLIIILTAVLSLFTGPHVSVSDRLLGAAVPGAIMLLLTFLTNGGIGMGDIKLMASSGLLLGWRLSVPAFFLAYVIAALYSLPSLLNKKIKHGSEIPMAPFFAVSLIFFSLFGRWAIAFYFSLFA